MSEYRSPAATSRSGPKPHPRWTETASPLEVTCYVRSDVTPPIQRQITSIRDRLKTLMNTQLVAETHIQRWPPRCYAIDGDAGGETCSEFIDQLEQWANNTGYSLRPAIRRHSVGSLLDDDTTTERMSLPVILLTLKRTDTEKSIPDGVVPYTIQNGGGKDSTYTVCDWLTAAEQSIS